MNGSELVLVGAIILGLLVGSLTRGPAVKLTILAGLAVSAILAGLDRTEAPRHLMGPHFVVDGPASTARLAVLLATLLAVFSLTRRQDHRSAVMLATAALGLVLLAEAVTAGGLLLASAMSAAGVSMAAWFAAPAEGHAAVRRWHLTTTAGFCLLALGVVLWSAVTGTWSFTEPTPWLFLPPFALPLIAGLLGVGFALALLGEPGRFGSNGRQAREFDLVGCSIAPPMLTGWLTAAPPLALAVVLHRLLEGAAPEHVQRTLPHLVMWPAAVLIFGGYLAALTRRSLERRLAWAATGQVGVALMGFSVPAGMSVVLPLLLVFATAQLGALALVGALKDLGPAGRRHRGRVLPLLMAFMLLSLSALPPLAGWRPRLGLLQALLADDCYFGAGLVLLGTLMGCFVYLRPLVDLWRQSGPAEEPDGRPAWAAVPALLSVAALTALLLVWSAGLLDLA